MLFNTVIFVTLSVLCVSSEIDQSRKHLSQYTRVKRGKYYSSPPLRFYNRPPMAIPIKGPFSYTPPPFVSDDDAPYPGSRPYKVSKRPALPNDGLADDDITNIVQHLSKQDLDKILEFAQEKHQNHNKYRDVHNTNEYSRPFKMESKILYKGNTHAKYEELPHYKEESFINYVTQTPYVKSTRDEHPRRPADHEDTPSQSQWFNIDNTEHKREPIGFESFSPSHSLMNSEVPIDFTVSNSHIKEPFLKVFAAQESPLNQAGVESLSPKLAYENLNGPVSLPIAKNPYFVDSDEEEKLPRPVNMRAEDFVGSFTQNVPKVAALASSYDIESFGDLPLMDYSSKLHDVSSYHVPHYTVTQPKPPKSAPPSPPISFSSYSSSSSSLLKPSPAAAAIKEPIYEPAPPASAAKEQSDAHLKATKIWSHRSKGAAYTLHDDGTLSPERPRPKFSY
ncbi:uncharacterized protein LOC142975853 [Anticarsia gemmatalis]|uniref:uncharacterized protein LOC142975853 n=1 Tax=Anticarsia gemmatalis TaxID=129554 RepID=UPI003F7651FC